MFRPLQLTEVVKIIKNGLLSWGYSIFSHFLPLQLTEVVGNERGGGEGKRGKGGEGSTVYKKMICERIRSI
jgi:hypothetical protein